MGADLLSRRQRHRAHHFRMARRSPGPQALFPDLHRHVHGVLVFLRHSRQSVAAHRVSSGARLFWRRDAAQSASDHPRHLPAGQARRGFRRHGHRHHRRAGAGADARRLHHRRGELALDFLHQCAGRRDRGFSLLRRGPGPAVGEEQEKPRHRLHRPVVDHAGARLPRSDDGPRRGRRLVRVKLYPVDGGAGCPRHHRRDHLAERRQEADRSPYRLPRPQFRRRLRDDLGDGRHSLRQRGDHTAVRAAGDRLHRDMGGTHSLARGHRGHFPDTDRRPDDEADADPLHHRPRLHAHGLRLCVFKEADAGHRL